MILPGCIVAALLACAAGLPSTANAKAAAQKSAPGRPAPVVLFTLKQETEKGGRKWVTYLFTVWNWWAYPAELFAPAPDLPPCGQNHNASRLYAHIRTSAGAMLQTYCGLDAPGKLQQIGFALPIDEKPPDEVCVVLEDRRTGTEYRSRTVRLEVGPFGQPETQAQQFERARIAQRAREEILDQVRVAGLAADDFRVEMVSGPVLHPTHRDWHAPTNVAAPYESAFVRGKVVSYTPAWEEGRALVLEFVSELRSETRVAAVDAKGGFRLGFMEHGRHLVRVRLEERPAAECLLLLQLREVRTIYITLNSASANDPVQCSVTDPPEWTFPAAAGRVAIYRKGEFQVERHFSAARGEKIFGEYPPLPVRLPTEQAMREEEWKQVSAELDAFFAAAADVTEGAQRFNRFLPADMKSARYGPGGEYSWFGMPVSLTQELTEQEMRQMVALLIDAAALSTWANFEGLRSYNYSGLPPHEWKISTDDPRAALAALRKTTEEMRRDLGQIGALNARHALVVRPFLEASLHGPPEKEQGPARPGGPVRTAYKVSLHSLQLFFERIDGKLTLIFAAYD